MSVSQKHVNDDFSVNVLSQITRNWDVEKKSLWWGKGWTQILGYEEANLQLLSSWQDNIHPDHLDQVTAFFSEAFSKLTKEGDITYRFKRADGIFLNVYDTVLITYQGSTPIHLAGFMKIIKTAELKQSVEPDSVTSLALEASGSGSFTLILESNEIIFSPKFSEILTGVKELPASRQIFIDHIHPDDSDVRNKAYQQAEKSDVLSYEARFIWQDGSVHWIKLLAKYVHDAHGMPISITGIVLDISQQVRINQALKEAELSAEKTIRESEALFRNITDASTSILSAHR